MLLALAAVLTLAGCSRPSDVGEEPAAGLEPATGAAPSEMADVVLTNGRVYTFGWPDPDPEGRPSAEAPLADPMDPGSFQPDAEALAVRGDRIVAVGSAETMSALIGPDTRVIDLAGATVVPGLVESHGHYHEPGEQADRVDVSEAVSVEEMAAAVTARLVEAAPGEWILGGGWDEGAWADRLPEHEALSAVSPDHPVVLLGRRGFGLLANEQAMDAAGIAAETPSPSGGEIVKGEDGEPTGVLLNRARLLVLDAVPEASLEKRKRLLLTGLEAMAESGYVTVHHAGVYSDYMPAYEALAADGSLPVRVEAMLAARPENEALMESWIARGPTGAPEDFLQVRGVKAYYDGSLGSRGASLLEDYSDQPGHRGVAGEEYDFDDELVARAMRAGFQVGIHAIGDAGNRAVLDFYEGVLSDPEVPRLSHRVEHAQIVHPDDFARFGSLGLVAAMQPGHAVEDSPWAEDRVGQERIRGGYAWRTLRRAGAGLIFSSDLAGTDWDIFYGLHCAVTRTDRNGHPEGGWYPEQAVTMEEAVRAYTVWPARASGKEAVTGTLTTGKWADVTVFSIDPFRTVAVDPSQLLDGRVLMTMVAGRVTHSEFND
jgi:predicted amidohydrolase YtcJ